MTVWHVTHLTALDDGPLCTAALALCAGLFNDETVDEIRGLAGERKIHLAVAHLADGTVGGFKLGYEDKPGKFYSWLGGVAPAHRRQGIAGRLMQAQHDWARNNGYSRIQTRTMNKWRDMLVLNIRHGFDIIGTYTDDYGDTKIILEKKI